jgi:hypothetical protein
MTTARWLLLLVMCSLLGACAGILGIRPRDPQHAFEHRAHSVAGVACVECHEGMSKAGELGPLHVPQPSKCVSCHKQPHDARACDGCHGVAHTRDEARLAREHLRFSHDRHLSPLGGQCVTCHGAAGKIDQASMRPRMAECFTCHTHKDQWAARDCQACHVDLPAELVRPSSHVVHEGDFVREHGVRAASSRDLCATCHSEAQCAGCHGVTVAALPWKLAFDRPALSGLHRAGFRQRHADESRANPALCTTCHGEGKFCADCHAQRRVGAGPSGAFRSPHPAGWVRARGGEHGREARLDPQACASCHGGRGEALCVGCHSVGGPGGNPHGRGFTSALDKLRDDPCRQCHVR